MSELYNVYCDESCHLENDHQKVMVLGAIWCPLSKRREIANRIREIKQKYGLSVYHEIKWTNVSPGQIDFYLELIDYFFDDDDLHFRALIVPNKAILNHANFMQTHDEWYYKMYFTMLKTIFEPHNQYRVYIDIKDTRGIDKIAKLHNVISNTMYDFSKQIVQRLQLVDSREIQQQQLADLLIGSVMYANRAVFNSQAKKTITERVKQRSGYKVTQTTLPRETKFNLLVWHPNGNCSEYG